MAKREWEMFCDASYYDMWAVRPVGDHNFNSPDLHHVYTEEQAKILKARFEKRDA